MHITPGMIHPELRLIGILIRFFLPGFTKQKFRMANRLLQGRKGKCLSRLRYEQHFVPRPDGSFLRIGVYSPLLPARDVPGLLWLHGGGYAMGIPEMDEGLIRRFIAESGCVVVAPDYRLSLDAPYPAALEDCYAALLWLKEQGGGYGMRGDQIMIGGESAGGGLTAAVTLYARDRGEVAVAFQMPLYPMIDDRMKTGSSTDNDAPLWNSASNRLAWELYLGPLAGSPSVPAYAAPARAADLKGLPPACTYVGGIEPFHDETADYAKRLREAGVPLHFMEFEGCFHAFDVAGVGTRVARQARAFLMERFRYAVSHYRSEQPQRSDPVTLVPEQPPFFPYDENRSRTGPVRENDPDG